MSDLVSYAEIVSNALKEKFDLVLRAVAGDKFAIIKLLEEISKGAFAIPDKLFYMKLKKFLSGVNFTDEDGATMSAWIAENGTESDNALRLVSYIDNAKSWRKVEYLANVTRCALSYGLRIELYFRICSAIDMTTEEDLKFLADNICKNDDKTFKQNYITQKLYSAGLMEVVNTIYDNGKHKFNYLARLVDVCAVSFADDSRYPNPKRTIDEIISNLDSQISE